MKGKKKKTIPRKLKKVRLGVTPEGGQGKRGNPAKERF